jgi:hypothetical protein
MPPSDTRLTREIFELDTRDPPPKASFLDKLLRVLTRMNPEDALYTLLHAAVIIDGRIDPDEIQVLQSLATRSRHLGRLQKDDPRRFVDMQKRIHDKLDELRERKDSKALWLHINEACEAIPEPWRLSAFAHVCDLMMADRVMPPIESKFVKTVAEYLVIPPDEAVRMLRNIRIKNEHFEDYNPGPVGSLKLEEETAAELEFEGLGVMSPQECVYAIHLCAVMADGTKLLVEGVELDSMKRVRSLAACSPALYSHIAKKVWRMGQDLGWDKLLENACLHLPNRLKLSAFGQAVDLTLADLVIHNDEKRFLRDLQLHLKLGQEEALEMFQSIRVKNEH